MLTVNIFENRDHAGESILHLWIEKLREHLETIELESTPTVQDSNELSEIPKKVTRWTNEDSPINKFSDLDLGDSMEECPSIQSANPFTERKSTFQGHVAPVVNVRQVK